MGKAAVPAWSSRDTALWLTCEVACDLAAGRPPTAVRDVATTFPPRLGPGEQLWAQGPFRLYDHRPIGDGTYVHNSGWFFATGAVGIAATVAVAVARSAGNSSRRAAAQAAAMPRWTPIDGGLLHVGSHGLYLHTPKGLFAWAWPHVTSMSMMAPGTVHLNGESDHGPVGWVLESDWSELVFALWALTMHPRHPQLRSGEWLPEGWLAHAAAHYPTRLATPALAGA